MVRVLNNCFSLRLRFSELGFVFKVGFQAMLRIFTNSFNPWLGSEIRVLSQDQVSE